MAFRVETSAEAELDAISILEWLIAQHAGDAGLRWFMALDEAIASLANFPGRCPVAPESSRFPFEVRQLLYGKSLTCTASCLLFGVRLCLFSIFATVHGGVSAIHTRRRVFAGD